jgi:hypothetical protein
MSNVNFTETDVYFASKEAKETSGILLSKANSFYNFMARNAYLEKLRQSYRMYHGIYNDDPTGYGHTINFTGEQGELVSIPVNHYRSIASKMLTMVTQNRPVMDARAINSDYKSESQVYLANNILDYYMREKKLEDYLKSACEMAIVFGSGFIKLEWNATSGEVYDTNEETGLPIYEGELEFTNLSPFDVVVDGTKESFNNEWVLIRTFKNRYNLIAKYPELESKIRGIPSKTDASYYRIAFYSNDHTDDIPVYEFYHKPTEAVPGGRYMLFSSEDCVFIDTKMPYRTLPLFRISAGDILGTPYGYTPMFDVMPIQEAINSLTSSILTNQSAFAVQNIFVREGSNLNISSFEGAMNIIEGMEKPEPLNLTQTPAEVFKFLDMMIGSAETLSGINSVARGNPEASLKSGTSLALVQSMALQSISGLQQSYVRLVEDVGTALIDILKDYASTPKVISIVGKNNRSLLREFTGESISNISRVIVDIGNPLSRTLAGRVQMAEQLLQMKAIKNPDQYFSVINTGRLDDMMEGDTSELRCIKRENEYMLEGQQVRALMLDRHSEHIMEHKTILNDPDFRNQPELVSNVLNHIQEHINYLKTTDPNLLQMIGQQPIMPPPPPPGPPAGPGGPEQMGPPPGNQGQPGEVMGPMEDQSTQVVTEAGETPLPNMPRPPAPFENLPVTPEQMAPGQ